MSPTLALLVLLGATASPPADDTFADVLATAERRMAAGRWDEARTLLLDAIAEHGPRDAVRIRSGEIREALRRCAFAEQVAPPDPTTLVAGQVLAHDARRATITLRYDASSPQRPLPTCSRRARTAPWGSTARSSSSSSCGRCPTRTR